MSANDVVAPEARAAADEPTRVEPLLEIEDLHVEIPTKAGPLKILNGVNLSVAPGEAVGIVGESGSGKSMTASALLGLLPPNARVTRGAIRFEGRDLLTLSGHDLRRVRGDRIGTILQDPSASLNPVLRVGWQVGEPLKIHAGLGGRALRKKVIGLLDAVGIVNADVRVGDYPHQFSGGMRQRIVGAAAIACEPALIVADEPTTALDVTVQARYLDLLEKLQAELGAALLFISHDLAVIGRLCQRVAVMYGGRIVETAVTDELFASPRHPYTIGLIGCIPSTQGAAVRLQPIEGQPPHPAALPEGCAFAARCPASSDECEVTLPKPREVAPLHLVACVKTDEGLTASDLWPPLEAPPSEARPVWTQTDSAGAADPPLLTLDNVSKTYGVDKGARRKTSEVIAAQEVTIEIRKGVAVSLVGQSGSGKTTCARIALGLESATTGRVLFRGTPLVELDRKGWRLYRRSLQAVFQDPYGSFNPRLSLGGAVAEPLVELCPEVGTKERLERVGDALNIVGLDPKRIMGAFPHQISGGQRQRVAIARALVTEPECLVLDEPVSALDVSVRLQVMNLLKDIQDRTGLGYLMISHDLTSVRYLSDEVAVMSEGRIVEHGTAEQIYERPRHEYTQSLLADALLLK